MTTLTPTPCRPPRDLVAAAAELAAGVQHGVHDFERVLAGLLLLADRARRGRCPVDVTLPSALDGQLDVRRMAGHRLVDRVVDDFPDEVVQAAHVGRADVHARALANRLEALEDLDALGGVGACGRGPLAQRGRGAVAGRRRPASERPSRSWSAPGQSFVQPFEVVLVVILDRDLGRPCERVLMRHFGRQRVAQRRLQPLDIRGALARRPRWPLPCASRRTSSSV